MKEKISERCKSVNLLNKSSEIITNEEISESKRYFEQGKGICSRLKDSTSGLDSYKRNKCKIIGADLAKQKPSAYGLNCKKSN